MDRINGLPGLSYGRYASASVGKESIGKFTDTNLLDTLRYERPAQYDKDTITLYSQLGLYANDFLDLLNQSTPYLIPGGRDSFEYGINLPYDYDKIIDIPASTYSQTVIGADGKPFEFVSKQKYALNDVLALGSLQFGDQIVITKDPTRYNAGWLHQAIAISVTGVSKKWLSVGNDIQKINHSKGEFDQTLSGLPSLGDKMIMYNQLGSEYGVEHTITGWADDRKGFDGAVDKYGRPADLLVYSKEVKGAKATPQKVMRWEPFIEFLMKKEMLKMRVKRFIWQKEGVTHTGGNAQELKKLTQGIYPGMKEFGNYVPFNKGELTPQLLRDVFGDLFYNRVDATKRRVKMYTNEAGLELFSQILKQDALGSGLNFTVAVPAITTGQPSLTSGSNTMTYNWNFNKMITRETGVVEVAYLAELDSDNMNGDAGRGRKKPPIFMVFDISDTTNGSLKENIREVRMEGRPGMIWAYVDGLRHHLGAFASQGHSAGNTFDGYKIAMLDRVDPLIEDFSKVVLIEEVGDQY